MSENKVERNAQKRGIMNTAWEIARRTGKTIAEAMKVAWRVFKLKVKAAAGVAYFSFVKKDGTVRVARGTTRTDAINYTAKGTGRKTPAHLMLFWDLDALAFRSFDMANLVTVA